MIYYFISLYSNRIYNLFTVERQYKYQIQNVSNQFWYFHSHRHFFIINRSIHQNKFHSYYIWFICRSRIKSWFNISTISSFRRYICCLVINLWLTSKRKSSKSSFWSLLAHFQSSKDNLIELTFNLSTILSVKLSIGCFISNLCLYSKGK